MTQKKTPCVLVIGLGYVGLPVALAVAKTGRYVVTGYDIDEKKIAAIRAKRANWISATEEQLLQFAELKVTSQEQDLGTYDYILICVPTPVLDSTQPDLGPVTAAGLIAARHTAKNGVVILESTVNPGVCEEIIVPILEEAGHSVGEDIFLAHCPERIDPGNTEFPLSQIPRVLGADSLEGRKKALELYESFLQAPVHTVSSLKVAEASKIVENTFRDINIAFVNELAQSFSHFNIDVTEVIDAAATKPFGFLPHYPGAGVGGHCIPVDPYYLIESAQTKGFEHRFLRLAREINSGMPRYTLDLLLWTAEELSLSAQNIKVALLGISYKPGISDTRNSPAVSIRRMLENEFSHIAVYDPYALSDSTAQSFEEALNGTQAVIIATAHPEFIEKLESLTLPDLQIIIDGRNCLKKWPAQVRYRGIGR